MRNGKLKLVFVIPHWLSKKGGITIYYRDLIGALKERGAFDISIITPDPFKEAGVMNIGPNKAILPFATLKALLKSSPDVIHCADHRYMILGSAIYKRLKPMTKLIMAFHTDVARDFNTTAPECNADAGLFKNILLRWAGARSDLVLFVSKYLEKRLGRIIDAKKKREIIPTGVSVSQPAAQEVDRFKARFGLKGVSPILCTMGLFEWEWKVAGIKLLLESFKELDHPNGKLIIVGDGKYRQYIEKTVLDLSLKDKVVLTGHLDDPCLALMACDIYCHLAVREALGMAILEAMACGRPVVAANRGGIPEIVDDGVNGILVEPSVPAIVKTLKTLIADKDLVNRLAKNAQGRLSAEHRWIDVAARYLDLMKEYEITGDLHA